MNRLRTIDKLISSIVYRTGFILLVISGIMMVIMGLLVSQGVVRRYIFTSPEPYSYEYTCFLLLACMLLPAVHVTSVERHIKADLLFNLFPVMVQSFLRNFVSPIIGLLFCAVVTWKSWELAWRSLVTGKVSSASGVPVYIVQMVVPVATGLICLVFLSKLAGYVISKRSSVGESDSSG